MTQDAQPVELITKKEVLALDVVGIGFPLVDVLGVVEDDHLDRAGLIKGSMTIVDEARAASIHETLSNTVEISGGSAANTMAGIASLGGKAGFIGRIADDLAGRRFVDAIGEAGVVFEPVLLDQLAHHELPTTGTGRCVILVTSDHERTMATHLGIGAFLTPDHVETSFVTRAQVLYVEGYQYDEPVAKEAIAKAIEAVHDAGGSVAISLSDSFCVDRHRADFLQLVEQEIEILFANADEAKALFKVDTLDEALDALEETGILAAITNGASGSVIVTPSGRITVEAKLVGEVVETTGAGDLYAAGFLYGLTQGFDLESCGELGSLCAGEVISHMGGRPERDLADLADEFGLL